MLTVTGTESFTGVVMSCRKFETWEEVVAWAEVNNIPEDWIAPDCQFERREAIQSATLGIVRVKIIYRIEFS